MTDSKAQDRDRRPSRAHSPAQVVAAPGHTHEPVGGRLQGPWAPGPQAEHSVSARSSGGKAPGCVPLPDPARHVSRQVLRSGHQAPRRPCRTRGTRRLETRGRASGNEALRPPALPRARLGGPRTAFCCTSAFRDRRTMTAAPVMNKHFQKGRSPPRLPGPVLTPTSSPSRRVPGGRGDADAPPGLAPRPANPALQEASS